MASTLQGSTATQVSIMFTMVDSVTGSAVPGTAYINGGATIVSGQQIVLSLAPDNYDLTCKADGYADNEQSFSVSSTGSSLPDTIQMTSTGAARVDVTLNGGVTGDPNATSTMYTVKDASGNVVASGSFDQSAGTAVLSGLLSGKQYQVERTANGYITENLDNNNAMSFTAAATASIPPMQKSGQNQQDLSATDPNAAAQTAATPAPVSNPVPNVPSYEWQYPNSSFGKYLTTTQARMYIGNVFIDEFHDVQFALQSNKVPVYGYCSRDPDAFGKGRALVQGQLSINFISEGYLYTVLRDAASQNPPKVDNNVQSAVALVQQKADPSLTPAQLTSVNTQLANIAAVIGPDKLDQVRKAVSASTLTSSGIKPNAVYQDVPFTLQLQMTGAGRTVTRTIKNCLLVSNEQVYDQSGEPLRDVYGFVAQSLL